ncbi:hypothetical protein NIES4103_47550 [Nostoc sp. NIES-4103]|nr:hypothetical protein NIES4103_47550 [Nostoc sp. NIES-4103]
MKLFSQSLRKQDHNAYFDVTVIHELPKVERSFA